MLTDAQITANIERELTLARMTLDLMRLGGEVQTTLNGVISDDTRDDIMATNARVSSLETQLSAFQAVA